MNYKIRVFISEASNLNIVISLQLILCIFWEVFVDGTPHWALKQVTEGLL
jgi:hypothetical protein